MKVFDGQSTVRPAHLEVLERGERRTGPVRRSRPRAGRSRPPTTSSNAARERAFRPLLGVER